jgi:signal transduction histidine kinase
MVMRYPVRIPRPGEDVWEPCTMEAPLESAADEVTRLHDCLNDLVSITALPALSTGGEPPQIVSTLLDTLLDMLRLAFVCVRFNDPEGGTSIEMVRVAESLERTPRVREISEGLDSLLGDAPRKWPPRARMFIGDVDLSVATAHLGLDGEIGVVVAGSQRRDFPSETERLLLDVAANQAAIGLQHARLLSDQKRLASDLDERIARRTSELAAANELLKKEVAERRRTEEALRESERESRLIVDSIPGLVAAFTPGGEVEFVNRQILEYFGETLEELKRWGTGGTTHPEDLPRVQRLRDIVHPEDVALSRGAIQCAIAGTEPEFYFRIVTPRGVVKHVRGLAYQIADRPVFVGAVQDVTASRVAEDALNRARSELAHVARVATLSALTASIAHEVNQPLSGIITNAGTCLRMLDANPPNVDGARETARRTIRDGNRASEVVARLRALFAKKEFALESLDLNEATREVIALSLSDLQRNRVVLQSELADDLPSITGDRVQLQQVILNLLRNASDAMVGVHDRPRQLLIRTEREDGDRVRVTVRDAGTGFDRQRMDNLFEAFYTTKSHGMGIGLCVSRSIVERHHGRLWAEPNDGPGATFSFSIPRAPESVTDAAPVMSHS